MAIMHAIKLFSSFEVSLTDATASIREYVPILRGRVTGQKDYWTAFLFYYSAYMVRCEVAGKTGKPALSTNISNLLLPVQCRCGLLRCTPPHRPIIYNCTTGLPSNWAQYILQSQPIAKQSRIKTSSSDIMPGRRGH